MFKKLLLSATFVMGVIGIIHAESYGTPGSVTGNQLPSSDYGGVNYTTITLSANNVLLFEGQGVFQGVSVSSFAFSTPPAFLILRDTATVVAAETGDEIYRIYLTTTLVEGLSTSVQGGGAYNFSYYPKHPIRVRRGAALKCSVATVDKITAYWTKFK